MRKIRNTFICCLLPLLFVWYIGGISLFPHTHIVDGVSIVHSHPNPDARHQGGEDYLTIQMLSQFQSCGEDGGVRLPMVEEFTVPEVSVIRDTPVRPQRFCRPSSLRAPPQHR
ncbi:MAG: hypothetical protein ACI395_09630 [Candidatus Cryptobacteroides sp.]